MVASSFVLAGTQRLLEKEIQSKYDGSYFDHETGEWHDTWFVGSEDGDRVYIVDVARETRASYCSCMAGNDFGKFCKHRKFLSVINELAGIV